MGTKKDALMHAIFQDIALRCNQTYVPRADVLAVVQSKGIEDAEGYLAKLESLSRCSTKTGKSAKRIIGSLYQEAIRQKL